jgi:ketosteroid isomerase-like protein
MRKLYFIVLLFSISVSAQDAIKLREHLEFINRGLSDAFLHTDVLKLTDIYENDAVSMPEHYKAYFGKESIKAFYKQWFTGIEVLNYKKDIYEMQVLNKDYLMEIGTFIYTYIKDSNKEPFNYTGKYFNIWKINENGLSLHCEIWGANAPFDNNNLKTIPATTQTPPTFTYINKKLEQEVKGRNKLIAQLVKDRNGEEHSELFTPDAIYMTYYTPMLVGIDKIKAYFVEHEKPGEVAIDYIDIRSGEIEAIGDYVLEYGFYTVDWRAGESSGRVEGKSINLWKRNNKGSLMLYRQAVNHDK